MTQALRRAIGLKEIDLVYQVPWIKGPHLERPFGLDTKYGHLVFVFQIEGKLYDAFFNPSAKALAKGYELQNVAMIVRSKEQLEQELAKRLPGLRFGLVLEGTTGFRQIMEELARDTIWPDVKN